MSMNGCWNYLLTDIEVGVCDTAKDTQYFLSQGLSVVYIKKSPIAWVCLAESMPDTEVLDIIMKATYW